MSDLSHNFRDQILMSPAPVSPPSSDEITLAAWLLEHLWSLIGWFISGSGLLGGIGYGIWHVSDQVAKIKQHEEKIGKHAERIEALEENQTQQAAEIASLPTQDRLDAVADRLERAMQAGFQNLTQIVTQSISHK